MKALACLSLILGFLQLAMSLQHEPGLETNSVRVSPGVCVYSPKLKDYRFLQSPLDFNSLILLNMTDITVVNRGPCPLSNSRVKRAAAKGDKKKKRKVRKGRKGRKKGYKGKKTNERKGKKNRRLFGDFGSMVDSVIGLGGAKKSGGDGAAAATTAAAAGGGKTTTKKP